ncbi:hypothetical protein Tco_0454072 [Tanacetum coccineum]
MHFDPSSLLYLLAMLCLSKLANSSVTLDSLRCSTELVGSTSTERLAVYYTKFSELLKLSREYQMLTVMKVTGPMRPITGNLLVPEKLPESSAGGAYSYSPHGKCPKKDKFIVLDFSLAPNQA